MKFQKLLFVVIISLAVRFSIERIKPFQDQAKDLAWANELKCLKTGDKLVYTNINHHIEGMFYTKSIMYNYVTSQQKDSINSMGYRVIENTIPDL